MGCKRSAPLVTARDGKGGIADAVVQVDRATLVPPSPTDVACRKQDSRGLEEATCGARSEKGPSKQTALHDGFRSHTM